MAQTGFTPILLYSSSTLTNVPLAANLTNSVNGAEIAINIADKNLFFKDSGGTVNTVPIRQSSTSSNGWLSATDWNTFNNKAPATSGTSILYGNGSGGFSNVTIGTGISFVGGTLSATGSGGTVTSVTGTSPVVSSGGTTPAISLATAYGDTLNPYASKTANYVLAAPNGSAGVPTFRALVAADVTGLGTMATQNANSVAITGGTISGSTLAGTTSVTSPIFKATNSAGGALQNASGTAQLQWGAGGGDNLALNVSTNINGTNAQIDISPTGTGHVHIKPTGTGAVEIAPINAGTMNNMVIGGTTPLAITGTTITATTFVGSGASLTGVVTSVGATSPVTSSGGTTPTIAMPAATTSVSGYLTSTDWNIFNSKQPAGTYVTSISIASSNGFTGTSSGGATPSLTLATSVTGILKGNGTAISAATSGTDYAPATSGTSILYGNGAGGFSNVTVGTGLTFIGGTLASTASGGTVTSVAATVPAFLSITGSPITTSGTLAISYSGTALPVANGGTGQTSFTTGYVHYGSFSTSSTFTYNGTSLTAGNFIPGSSTVPTNGIYLPAANIVGFATNTTEVMRIDSSSNLLIGTTAVSSSCKQTLQFVTGNNGLCIVTPDNINAVDFAIFKANGAICGNISRVGSTSAVVYTATSDYRLKENIKPFANALASICKLKPVTYTWKDCKIDANGFIAHELQEVCPDAVIGIKDEIDDEGKPKYQAIDQSKIVALLTAALQELNTKFDAYVSSHP